MGSVELPELGQKTLLNMSEFGSTLQFKAGDSGEALSTKLEAFSSTKTQGIAVTQTSATSKIKYY